MHSLLLLVMFYQNLFATFCAGISIFWIILIVTVLYLCNVSLKLETREVVRIAAAVVVRTNYKKSTIMIYE